MDRIAGLAVDYRARMDELIARATEREAIAERDHRERLAALPPGTCPRCYGETTVIGEHGVGLQPCPTCCPPTVHAIGVPVEFHAARFENYRIEPGNEVALEKARAFTIGTRDMFMSGGVGSGKTRLACTIANEVFLTRATALFVRVPMVLYRLQPGRHEDDIAALEDQLFGAPVVVLDDLGAERDMATDFTRRTLLMIYEERGDRGHRTIFTSNKTLNELAAMQDDDRLASRIAGRADVVKLSTPDQRLRRVR